MSAITDTIDKTFKPCGEPSKGILKAATESYFKNVPAYRDMTEKAKEYIFNYDYARQQLDRMNFPYQHINKPPHERGYRDDKSKIGVHLLPVLALSEVDKVLDYGRKKYSTPGDDAIDNWRKGLSWRSTTGSLLRHAFAYLRGEDYDPESGLYHMAHVAVNALFLIQYAIEGKGTDDRAKEIDTRDKSK